MKSFIMSRMDFIVFKFSIIIITAFILHSIIHAQGSLKDITFYSNSLNTTRNVQIYLPPDYNTNDSKRYPVIYFLHGATQNQTSFPESAGILNEMINNYIISPVIVVKPDGSVGPWAGSMYTNSELYGNFEDYIVYDLVKFIDSTYKTIPDRNKRAIWGGSMGGYGSMKLALKHPDIYRAVAAHSGPLDFSHFAEWVPILLKENGGSPVDDYKPTTNTFTWLFYTVAGAFSPDLENSPYQVDFPLDSMGNFIDSVYNRWLLQNPVGLASKLPLNSDLAIYFDCGTQDELLIYPFNTGFADSLDLLGINYVFESFIGKHSDKILDRVPVALRFIDSVLNKYGNIYAIQPSLNKSYMLRSADSVLFRTTFTNIYNHQFTSHLIYVNSDNTLIDSLTLYDDGLHGDLLSNDGIYGGYIPPTNNEDFYSVGVSTVDGQTNKYFYTPGIGRFTTVGPLTIDSLITSSLPNLFAIKPFVHNRSNSATIKNASIKIYSNDPWVESVSSGTIKLPEISPGSTSEIQSIFLINYIDSLCPGYINVNFEIMNDGWTYWNDSIQVPIPKTTGITDKNIKPLTFNLEQNYPNPFNPMTKIRFSIPHVQKHGHASVLLEVYDMLGRKIAILVNEKQRPGEYEVEFRAENLPSGVYFYKLKAGEFIQIKKMILIK